jgi:glycosyltransferase involved in cell wall biosynthesis
MIWAAIIILYLTGLRMVVAVINLISRPFLTTQTIASGRLVSVLIPARNEEQNIGKLLDSLLAQKYQPLEIIVYNDSSSDGTGAIVKQYAETANNIRCVDGGELPAGWLGKNNACNRLAEEAAGDYLLFIDADVVAGNTLIGSGVARMEEKRLSLLSIFPHQTMVTRGEKVVVPVMNWILLSLLPMVLVRSCRWSSFSAANGQFMMFRTSVYRKYRFHEMVKMNLTEDIVIARIMKRLRLRIETLVGRGEVSCRMYTGYDDAVNGFSKNVITMFGDSYFFISFFVLVSLFGWIVVLAGLDLLGLAIYTIMAVVINVSVAATAKQNIGDSLLLFPERMDAFRRIVLRAFTIRRRKNYTWKERTIGNIE